MISLEQVRDWLRGEDVIVCGTGPSFQEQRNRERREVLVPWLTDYWLIACNRAAPDVQAPFVVCLEGVDDPVWRDVALAAPVIVFLNDPGGHHRAVRFVDDMAEMLAWRGRGPLRGMMSPWYGAAIAAHMGARRVGLIGVDIIGHSAFGDPARWPELQEQWSNLRDAMERRDQELVLLEPANAASPLFGVLPRAWLHNFRPRFRCANDG